MHRAFLIFILILIIVVVVNADGRHKPEGPDARLLARPPDARTSCSSLRGRATAARAVPNAARAACSACSAAATTIVLPLRFTAPAARRAPRGGCTESRHHLRGAHGGGVLPLQKRKTTRESTSRSSNSLSDSSNFGCVPGAPTSWCCGQVQHVADGRQRDGGPLDVAHALQELHRVLVHARVELHHHDELGGRQEALADHPTSNASSE